jgi:superfamily II DNA or RNA helicase
MPVTVRLQEKLMDREIPSWLSRWVRGGRVERGGVQEVLRRLDSESLTPKDLRTLLLVPLVGLGESDVRSRVLSYVEARPHLAVSIFAVHSQFAGVPLPAIEPQPAMTKTGLVFQGRAVFTLGDRHLEGDWHVATSKTSVRHAANVSVLKRLVEITAQPAEPVVPSLVPAPRAEATPRVDVTTNPMRAQSFRDWVAMTPKAFLAALSEVAGHAVPDDDFVRHTLLRARSGLLDDRQLAVVLFRARSHAWDEARREGLLAASRIPPMLARVVNQYSSFAGVPTARFDVSYDADGLKSAWAELEVGRETRRFGPARDAGQAAAKQAVRLMLLADLAGLAPPDQWPQAHGSGEGWLVVSGDRTPINVLDVAVGQRVVSSVCWSKDPAVRPRRARVTCTWRGTMFAAAGEGELPQQARQAAATSLILMINAEASRPDMASTQPPPTRDTSPAPDDQVVPAVDEPTPDADVSTLPDTQAIQPMAEAESSPEGRTRLLGTRAKPVVGTLSRDAVAVALAAGDPFAFDTVASAPVAGLLCWCGTGYDEPGAMVERTLVGEHGETWDARWGRVATGDAIALLSSPSQDGWSTSARLWARVVGLGLDMIGQGRVRPALADTDDRRVRYPTWRVRPFQPEQQQVVHEIATALETSPSILGNWLKGENVRESVDLVRAVRGMLDAVADHFVPSSGRRYVLGPVPFTGAVCLDDPSTITAMQRWIDDLESDVADASTPEAAGGPSLLLTIKPPTSPESPESGAVLTGTLGLCPVPGSVDSAIDADDVWHEGVVLVGLPFGPDLRDRVRRILRLAGRTLPSLEALGADPYPARFCLSAADAAALRGSAAQTLRELGIAVRWDKDWATHLAVEAVVGPTATPLTGRLGLGELFDRRWRITADGQVLERAELDRLRAAELPWIMEHNRWILVDDVTREALRRPVVETIPRSQGLLDVLDGWVTINGHVYACTPADGLGALIADLRSTDYEAATRQADDESPITLRPHQARAVAWLTRMSTAGFGCLLADDMGLGKTITTIAFHHSPRRPGRALPTLVICPNEHVMSQWQQEIETRTASTTDIYWGARRSLSGLESTTIVLTTYGVVQQSGDELAGVRWGLVVADEAQKIKNMGTGAARWVRTIPSVTRVALSGTPVENRPSELWAILDWCNPDLLGTHAEFHTHYVRPITDAPDADTGRHARDRVQRVLRPFLLRRRKDDPALGLGLLGTHETTHVIWPSDRQRGMLEALENDNREQLKQAHRSTTGQLAQTVIHQQRQITNSPAHYLMLPVDAADFDPVAVEAETPKLARLRTLLEPLRNSDERVLVFTHYVYPAEMIAVFLRSLGYRVGLYTGRVSEDDRKTLVAEFTEADTQILVATITTAGIGLDLTRANHVVHFERHWNPAIEAQATDRAYRMGQTRVVHVHYLVTRNSIEDRIAVLLASKRDLADLYLPDDELDFNQLTATELVSLALTRT